MAIVGYVRVSSVDQNTGRQLEGITLDKRFEDKLSGKSIDRPELQAAIEYLREGDTLVCHSMDRLARNLDDLRKLVSDLTKRGIRVQFIKENLTFTGEDSPMANLLLSMLGAVAQFERDLIRERQREGIALAKKDGVYLGRKPSLSPVQIAEIKKLAKDGSKKSDLAETYKVSRQTIYQALASENLEAAFL
jgi:DNA invertase Pin-like site-specific DNA recombinase